MNIGIPANSTRAVIFDESGICIVLASAPFFIRSGESRTLVKVSQGQRIGKESGESLGRVEFVNQTSASIDVSTGPFNTQVENVRPDITGAVPVDNITDPHVYTYWDTVAGGASPLDATINPVTGIGYNALPLPPNKPFRRLWPWFEASVFPNDNILALAFYLNGVLVHSLTARFKSTAGATDFGIVMNQSWDNGNRLALNNSMFYKSTGTGGTYVTVPSYDLKVVADKVAWVTFPDPSGITGNMRAMLHVQSSDSQL